MQGEVEQIFMMKPRAQGPHDVGLLEYLEDIIGTDKYVERSSSAASSEYRTYAAVFNLCFVSISQIALYVPFIPQVTRCALTATCCSLALP